MSLGRSDMAGGALGTALSLLLLASIIQGLQDSEVFYRAEMEAVVGQNVTLPCTVKSSAGLKMISIEWRKNKNGNTKLALYSPSHGINLFWTNVTIQIENNSMGAYLHLHRVAKWDSGIYICALTTYPQGTFRGETELKIKDADVEIMCDVDGTVEVHAGENVTIHCRSFPNARHKWTKNKELVSANESLELWWVTDAHAGVYALTVNTGNKTLHKEFIITVLTATTSLRTDLVTVSPQSTATDEGLIEPPESGPPTSPTTGIPTIDINVTMSLATGVTDDNPNPSNVTITAGQLLTSVTSPPSTQTDSYHTSNDEANPTRSFNISSFSDRSVADNLSTTLRYRSAVFGSTQETRNAGSIAGNSDNPGATPTLSSRNTMINVVVEGTDSERSHLLLVLIIAPMLVLITGAGFLYRRQIIKQRMDLPPPFKPPPPPVKYTAARHHKPFPTSRCNSVTELDTKQDFIYV
ncbi:T-cell surface protein tactile [Pempheris klunzingeri]|uniref:T-cell surface protein tactile n=1 Tax=Pempheris klunzingeri TaxID=3127111 RepID=UPI00398075E6